MTRPPINIERTAPGTPRFAELTAFAGTFEHCVWADRPAVIVKRGQRMIGYAQFIEHPIGVPSWHTDPEVCSPRDIFEGAAALRSWQQGCNVLGSVMILVFDTPDRMSDATIAALGFRPMNARLYISEDNSRE